MRLIDADALEVDWCDDYETEYGDVYSCTYVSTYQIDNAPTVDAEPVRHGEWEVVDAEEPRRYGCSECKRLVWHLENYCPNCGAKMEECSEAD